MSSYEYTLLLINLVVVVGKFEVKEVASRVGNLIVAPGYSKEII